MLLTSIVLIAVGIAVYVIFPLLSVETAGGALPVDVTPLADLKRRRLALYDNLKDLEFEFQSGKIAREDYEELRTNYLGEAASLMAATQEAEVLKQDDTMIEREIAARRRQRKAQPRIAYICPACGYQNPLPVKFCGECGARIAAPRKKD
jgi:rubrerythrin